MGCCEWVAGLLVGKLCGGDSSRASGDTAFFSLLNRPQRFNEKYFVKFLLSKSNVKESMYLEKAVEVSVLEKG